jgi:sec-independent protein translocase protein TatC
MFKYLLEIKYRVFFILINLLITIFTSYLYKEVLLFLVLKPHNTNYNSPNFFLSYFIFTDITEIFSVYFKLIYFISLQVLLIYAVYHLFIFFSYAMFKKEYSFQKSFLVLCLLTWIFSLLLLKFILLPLSWNFFYSFQKFISSNFITLHFEPKLNEYLNFCLFLYYTCVFYCQFFSIMFFWLNYYNSDLISIKKTRKFYYFIFVIFSTIISPPDIFSQLIISLLLVFLYEIFVFFSSLKILLLTR